MKIYTCPMHPEVRQKKPGKCPKCGMNLVEAGKVNNPEKDNYSPLLVVVGLIFLVSLILAYRDLQNNTFLWQKLVAYIMSGFFLVFGGFKLIDLKGFAQGYSTYDLLAKKFYAYGYIYPFIEIFFGLSMILDYQSKTMLLLEFIVMFFSGIGVALKLLKKERFRCVCLGTILKVPLTKVTLVEDFGMAALALLLLFFA